MILVLGLVCVLASIALVFAVVLRPRTPRLPLDRRRPVIEEPESGLTRFAGVLTDAIDGVLRRRGWNNALASALEQAGIRLGTADAVILVGIAAVVGLLAGSYVGGLLLGIVGMLVVAAGACLLLRLRRSRRRRRFADQLDETLQLLAGGLRAGHSLLRAIDAVSHEAEAPSSEEFARIINETRIGRDLTVSMNQTAERMACEDFSWVSQAIGIHREVGGDLAEVLDQVGATIRERGQIRGQVKALAAEGKMSAYILVALPILIALVLMVISPGYLNQFGEHIIGYGLVGLAVVMLTIGSIWMSRVVKVRF
jgi:tight adherence protein B